MDISIELTPDQSDAVLVRALQEARADLLKVMDAGLREGDDGSILHAMELTLKYFGGEVEG